MLFIYFKTAGIHNSWEIFPCNSLIKQIHQITSIEMIFIWHLLISVIDLECNRGRQLKDFWCLHNCKMFALKKIIIEQYPLVGRLLRPGEPAHQYTDDDEEVISNETALKVKSKNQSQKHHADWWDEKCSLSSLSTRLRWTIFVN